MHVGMCAFFQNLDGQHIDREVLPRMQALAPRSPFHAP